MANCIEANINKVGWQFILVVVAVVGGVLLYIGGSVGSDWGKFTERERFRLEAVAQGHAEFVMNPTNGVVTWRWK